MSNNFNRNYQHFSERVVTNDNNCRINQRHGAELPPGSASWEVKFVDEYLAKLAYEKQQQLLSSDDSGRSVSTDPAAEDFEMDEVSMPDSILLHRNDLSSGSRNRPRSSLYRNNYSSMILEDVPYAPSSLPARARPRHTSVRRLASRVSFAEEALMYSCDCSYEEVMRTWYNKDELSSFKQDRKDLIKVLKKHHFDLPVVEKTYGRKYCLRGYEPYFSLEGNKEIRRNREFVLSSVLKEQSRQRQSFGIIADHDVIGRHCTDASKWARDGGYRLGIQDSNQILKEYGQDIKPQHSYQKWERMIGKSIQDVAEQHDAENLQEAMEYSLLEQRQQQLANSFLSGDLRNNLQRSMSEELLRMQREQLQILQSHQEQQIQNNSCNNVSPNLNSSRHEYNRQQANMPFVQHGDFRNSQGVQLPHELAPHANIPFVHHGEFRNSQTTQQTHELAPQANMPFIQHGEFRNSHDTQQTHELAPPQDYWMQDNEAQQRRLQEQHNNDRVQRLQELERQQVLRLQQMEMEQNRQQEQLRLMMEEQQRMEEHIRRQSQFNGGESVDEELENALKLVEALQFNPQQL